jgi:RNA-binding protein
MSTLTSGQRKFLRSKAHHLDPIVSVGKLGITDALILATSTGLENHELIKIKFKDHKDKKKEWTEEIATKSNSQVAGLIGNIAILYKPNPDEEKQKFTLPKK